MQSSRAISSLMLLLVERPCKGHARKGVASLLPLSCRGCGRNLFTASKEPSLLSALYQLAEDVQLPCWRSSCSAFCLHVCFRRLRTCTGRSYSCIWSESSLTHVLGIWKKWVTERYLIPYIFLYIPVPYSFSTFLSLFQMCKCSLSCKWTPLCHKKWAIVWAITGRAWLGPESVCVLEGIHQI